MGTAGIFKAGIAGILTVIGCWSGALAQAYTPAVGDRFIDCADCPVMVRLPTGSFVMGSSAEEQAWVRQIGNRDKSYTLGGKIHSVSDEHPQLSVQISKPIAMSETEVTLDQFRAFLGQTGHAVNGECLFAPKRNIRVPETKVSFQYPGFAQAGDHPTICVSWHDAQSYVAWLSNRTGRPYRLPTEAEWEFAARAGTTTARYWGDDQFNNQICNYENTAGQEYLRKYPSFTKRNVANCEDNYVYTSPVYAFGRNQFGLYGMLGNAFEWVQDCYHRQAYTTFSAKYPDAVTKADVSNTSYCPRVIRGFGFLAFPFESRAAFRYRLLSTTGNATLGFRIARDLEP